jgi:hypothetical protein
MCTTSKRRYCWNTSKGRYCLPRYSRKRAQVACCIVGAEWGFNEEEINRLDAYHYQRTLLFTALPLPVDASVYRVGAEWWYHEGGVKPEAATNVSVSRNTAAIFGPVYCTDM